MAEHYLTYEDHLMDVVRYGELLKKEVDKKKSLPFAKEKTQNTAKKDAPAPAEVSPDDLLKAIKDKAAESMSRGVKIPLENIIKKKRLNEDEAKILYILVYAHITRQTDYSIIGSVLEILCAGRREEYIRYIRYFEADSDLYRKKILTSDAVIRRLFGVRNLELDENLVRVVLGCKIKRSGDDSKRFSVRMPSVGVDDVYEKLNERVTGHDYAKKTLATALYQHAKRAAINKKRKLPDRLDKSNILIIGPTGVGKTLLVKSLASIAGMPVAFCDATQYTETGYVGLDVEDMLTKLYNNAGKDRRVAERGIIYIDEIDKIAAPRNAAYDRRDISGIGVQQELLKILEGDEISYHQRHVNGSTPQKFDVGNVLFFASGAFSGLEDIIKERLAAKSGKAIGFGAAPGASEPASEKDRGNLMKFVTGEDLIKYGFMPEFIGRFPVIVALDTLEKSDIIDIMTRPRNAIVKQYNELFRECGLDMELNPAQLEEIAEEVIQRGVGARGLRAIFEKRFGPMMFERLSATQRKSAAASSAGNADDADNSSDSPDGEKKRIQMT